MLPRAARASSRSLHCVGEGRASDSKSSSRSRPWAYDDVQAEAQALFAERFVPAAFTSPIGVVGVVDESAFAKKGTKSSLAWARPAQW